MLRSIANLFLFCGGDGIMVLIGTPGVTSPVGTGTWGENTSLVHSDVDAEILKFITSFDLPRRVSKNFNEN